MTTFRDVYYQQSKRQGTLAYSGTSLKPTTYTEEEIEGRRSVVYEYVTYDEPFSEREIIFYVPMDMLRGGSSSESSEE